MKAFSSSQALKCMQETLSSLSKCFCVVICWLFSASRLTTFELDCNATCNCDRNKFSPICGRDKNTYFSACHAGCQNITLVDGKIVSVSFNIFFADKVSFFLMFAMGWDCESVELQPLTDPLSILHMMHEWIWNIGGMILTEKAWRTWRKTLLPCPPQIPYGQACQWTQVSVVRSWWLAACAMAWWALGFTKRDAFSETYI
jgi:hypothetical protein